MKRKAKIAGTLGPACDDDAVLTAMIRSGLDAARLNFSHGDETTHRERAQRLRKVASKLGKPVALMADLQGPRFRVGTLPGGTVDLVAGSEVVLEAGRRRSTGGRIPVAYASLARDVAKGDTVLFDDGKLVLRVLGVDGNAVRCRVVRGGPLSDHKGINIPGKRLSAPALTAKDRQDLKIAADIGADWLAVSFVRGAKDVRTARKLLDRAGSTMPIMAKIERPEAVDDLDAIVRVSDGILVARGDLGVELPPERVPILQKQMIETTVAAGKPVMIATQMLESMRNSTTPTRAEASDVANAVMDGSGSLLLTAETAVGAYPVEAIAMMARIIEEVEGAGRTARPPVPQPPLSITEATCHGAARAACEVDARFIAVFTVSGSTARNVARFRPTVPVLAFTPTEEVSRRMSLYWGVEGRHTAAMDSTDQLLVHLDETIRRHRLARKGDRVVVVAGHPVGVSGNTNVMTVRKV